MGRTKCSRKRREPSAYLPTRGVTLVAREEVGGRDFYERHSAVPHCPGVESAITIRVGYDLRFSGDIFEGDWGDKLPADALAACGRSPAACASAGSARRHFGVKA